VSTDAILHTVAIFMAAAALGVSIGVALFGPRR
jgi:hypothetical protein